MTTASFHDMDHKLVFFPASASITYPWHFSWRWGFFMRFADAKDGLYSSGEYATVPAATGDKRNWASHAFVILLVLSSHNLDLKWNNGAELLTHIQASRFNSTLRDSERREWRFFVCFFVPFCSLKGSNLCSVQMRWFIRSFNQAQTGKTANGCR